MIQTRAPAAVTTPAIAAGCPQVRRKAGHHDRGHRPSAAGLDSRGRSAGPASTAMCHRLSALSLHGTAPRLAGPARSPTTYAGSAGGEGNGAGSAGPQEWGTGPDRLARRSGERGRIGWPAGVGNGAGSAGRQEWGTGPDRLAGRSGERGRIGWPAGVGNGAGSAGRQEWGTGPDRLARRSGERGRKVAPAPS